MIPRIRFRTLHNRILLFFAGLFALVQGVTFVAVTTANSRSASQQIANELAVTERVFRRQLEERIDQLTQGARLLSGDFAFKLAYANGDRATLRSAVDNLLANRLHADVMLIADAKDYSVVIDTNHAHAAGQAYPFPALIEAAEDSGRPSSALRAIDGALYRLAVVPLLAPDPIAWITVGLRIDDAFAGALKAVTATDISFLVAERARRREFTASTLPGARRARVLAALERDPPKPRQSFQFSAAGERYIAIEAPLDERVSVVLQRSLDAALAPFQHLRRLLLGLILVSLAVCAGGGILIARGITRPLRTLVESTRRIAAGDYASESRIRRFDEIGELATAFNHMTRGLRAFQRYLPVDLVRTLIARGIESKPESRLATILFADIEGFTALAETMSPRQVVALLNDYFTTVSEPIEKHGGVITQFQGDAVLAVFNVPSDDPDHAEHAVRAAIEIQALVSRRTFAGGIHLKTRLGINTGDVIAGSVGSDKRVNYTVHGDAVNLAARLETLNKTFASRVLVSQATLDRVDGRYPREKVGDIEIRGKRSAVTVYKLA